MKWLLFECLAVCIFGFCPDTFGVKPIINSLQDELVLEEGFVLKIECFTKQAHDRLKFSFPEQTFESPRSNHEISVAENGTLTFFRRSVVFLDTGWYACAEEGIQIDNHYTNLNHTQEDIAWIYVYVKSSEPFADRYYTFPKPLIASANGSTLIIPCRPTSPNLDVQLRRSVFIRHMKSGLPPRKFQFDSKIGFIIEEVVDPFPSCWVCVTNNGIKDQYIPFHFDATGSKPTIVPNTGELLLQEGDELRIECYGKTDVRFITNDTLFDDYGPLRSKYKILQHMQNNITFLRSKVIPEDAGWYGCAEKAIDINPNEYLYINYTRKEVNWLYVYVKADYNRLVIENRRVLLYQKTGASLIFPCLPTSPNFEVMLRRGIETYTNAEMDENIRFHPKIGFVIRQYTWKYYKKCSCGTSKPSNSIDLVMNFNNKPHPWKWLYIIPLHLILLTEDDLKLECILRKTTPSAFMEWIIPSAVLGKRIEYTENNYDTFMLGTLKMTKVMVSDSGEYVCQATEGENIRQVSEKVLVFDRKVTDYINSITDKRGTFKFIHRQNETVNLIVEFEYEAAIVQWFRPSNQLIDQTTNLDPTRQIFHSTHGYRNLLQIKDITFDHAGVYRLRLESYVTIFVNYVLVVHAPPTVFLNERAESYYGAPNEVFSSQCNTIGLPMPNITWTFTKDPRFSSDSDFSAANLSNYNFVPTGERSAYSYINMSTDIPGTLFCTACNYIDCSTANRRILISDGLGRFGIIGPVHLAFVGDEVVLTCAGFIHAFQNLTWNQKFNQCYKNAGSKMFDIKESRTRLTMRRILHLKNVTKCHSGSYSCVGRTISNQVETVSYDLNLYNPQKPSFSKTNMDGSKIVVNSKSNDNKTRLLICCADGNPQPHVTWFKENLPLKKSRNDYSSVTHCEVRVSLDLNINEVVRYKCKAENRFGYIEDYIDFVFEDEGVLDAKLLILIIAVVWTVLIIPVVWLVVRNHRRKVARRKFKDSVLKRFDRGALQYIHPHMSIADQADILPYDKKWEYPRNLLKFGKILGSGAFGLVRRAEAKSICPGQKVTTVAVKMVRAVHRLDHMTALSRELKVLVYLGQHENIVNLLGACTKNIDQGELFVIVEHCRFGNIQSYLYHRRADFINQIEAGTDFSTNPIFCTNAAVDHSEGNSDAGNSCSDINSTGASVSTTGDRKSADDPVASDLQCQWKGDYTDVAFEPISTKDLLCWAWQVSRGMRYLGLRKVIHGDLAARNILLADHNVVKICDFGISKALSYHESYKKQEHGPLPLKWSAIESIKDRVFSPESDVWSFGIVLWEFFTLAKSPYPGIHPTELYGKLIAGYRMEQPKYANKSIYRMMMSCWDIDPAKRPSFPQLERAIEELLDDSAKKFYVDLSATYIDLNNRTLGAIEKDYLTMDPSQIAVASFSKAQEKVEICTVTVDESQNPVRPEIIPHSQDDSPTASSD